MTPFLALLEAEYPLLVVGITLILGLIIGSFLNVVIYRLPKMLERDWQNQAREVLGEDPMEPASAFNLVVPNSHCPHCDTEIKPWQNIPVFSYLLLKGRCSACGAGIAVRYPVIETLTAVLTMAVIARFGLNWTGFACCLLTWALIVLSWIDYDTQLLPDNITLPMLWLGLIVNYFGLLVPAGQALWGAVIGYLCLWFIFWGFKLLTGKEGMGHGDFKLLAMLGAWMGWQFLPMIIILSSVAGALIGGTLIVLGRDRSHPIPFGPYLAIAGWISLIWGDRLLDAYLNLVLTT